MLSKEAIEDLKTDCSFEEIQRIEQGLKDIEEWNIYTQEQVDDYINNTLFAKYKAHV